MKIVKSKLEQHLYICEECDAKNVLCEIGGKLLRDAMRNCDDRKVEPISDDNSSNNPASSRILSNENESNS